MTKYIAPNGGIAITDREAVQAFYSSVIPKPTQSMPGVHSLAYAAERAEKRLIESGFPVSEFEGATLFYRNAVYRFNGSSSIRSANFRFRRDADGWKLIEIQKYNARSEIFDRHFVSVSNPELREHLRGTWNI